MAKAATIDTRISKPRRPSRRDGTGPTTAASVPPAASPAEPSHVTHLFGVDPFDAAREELVRHVVKAAKSAVPGDALAGEARAAALLLSLEENTADDHVCNIAADFELRAVERLAGMPAFDIRGASLKLATLARVLLRPEKDSRTDFVCLGLVAGALADLVTIGDGPLTMPGGALDAIVDGDDIAKWRRIAAGRGEEVKGGGV